MWWRGLLIDHQERSLMTCQCGGEILTTNILKIGTGPRGGLTLRCSDWQMEVLHLHSITIGPFIPHFPSSAFTIPMNHKESWMKKWPDPPLVSLSHVLAVPLVSKQMHFFLSGQFCYLMNHFDMRVWFVFVSYTILKDMRLTQMVNNMPCVLA